MLSERSRQAPHAAPLALLVLALSGAAHAGTLTGFLEARGIAFAERTGGRDPQASLWGTLFVEGKWRPGALRLVGSIRAEARPAPERGRLRFDPADRRPRRAPIQLGELYLRGPLASGIDLQAGRFLLGWGRTDGYSPADAFLPRDLTDPFADEKLPLWGARLTGERRGLRFDALAVAPATPWRLPVLEGRYAAFPLPGVILVDGAQEPPGFGFAATRLQASRAGFDLGLWARAGNRPAPLLVFRDDLARQAEDGIELPVDRRFVAERGLGLELGRVLGSFIVRTELGRVSSPDRQLGQAWLLALSLERSFGDDTLLVTVAASLGEPPIDPALLLDRAFLPAMIAAWNRTSPWGGWKLAWTARLEEGDGLVEAELSHRLDDRFSVTAGLDLPYGPPTGPLGALGGARRLRAALRRSW